MAGNNIYHYDVLNAHYVKGVRKEDGTIDFSTGTAKALPGLMSMDLGAQGDTNVIRADGINYIATVSNEGYSGKLTFVKIPEEFKVDCLGEVKDTATGIQYENADVEPSPFALMGEFKGDQEHIRWIFYNCIASRPSAKGDNKSPMKDPDTEDLTVTASPLPATIGADTVSIVKGGVLKSDNETTYTSWYTKVTLPGTAPTSSTTTGAGQ